MTERKTYPGRCHCGAVTFEVTSDFGALGVCNCSICSRLGWVMQTVSESDFKLLGGGECLSTYRFNTRMFAHQFCRVCGIESFARGEGSDGKIVYTINTACLTGFPDIERTSVRHWDGRSW